MIVDTPDLENAWLATLPVLGPNDYHRGEVPSGYGFTQLKLRLQSVCHLSYYYEKYKRIHTLTKRNPLCFV